MRKTIITAGVLASLVFVTGAAAKQGTDGPKATDVRISKKQAITDDERKAIDAAKGRPSSSDKKVSSSSAWATGIGVPLPDGGKRYAIVAGLGNYTGTDYDLCVAAAKTSATHPEEYDLTDPKHYCQDYDSVNMVAALNGYGFDEIVHLRDYQATRAGIMAAMDALAAPGKLTDKDEVVFFFSGHGTSGSILGDSEATDEAIFTYDLNYIWDDELKAWADKLTDYRTVFAFDSCLSGGMNDLAGADRVVVMSSQETQSSWTYTLGGALLADGTYAYSEGLFSHNFVKDGIVGKLADGVNATRIKDGSVAVEEAFGYTYPIVKKKQTPVLSDGVANDLIP